MCTFALGGAFYISPLQPLLVSFTTICHSQCLCGLLLLLPHLCVSFFLSFSALLSASILHTRAAVSLAILHDFRFVHKRNNVTNGREKGVGRFIAGMNSCWAFIELILTYIYKLFKSSRVLLFTVFTLDIHPIYFHHQRHSPTPIDVTSLSPPSCVLSSPCSWLMQYVILLFASYFSIHSKHRRARALARSRLCYIWLAAFDFSIFPRFVLKLLVLENLMHK